MVCLLNIFTVISLSSSCILPFLHSVKSCLSFLPSPLQNTYDLLLPPPRALSPIPFSPPPFSTFPASVVAPDYIFKFTDLELGSTDKRTQSLYFWLRVTSLNIVLPSSTHLPANLMIIFFFTSEKNSIVHLYPIFIMHSPVARNLVSFYFLHIVNRAAMNMVKQISVVGCWVLQICAKARYNSGIW